MHEAPGYRGGRCPRCHRPVPWHGWRRVHCADGSERDECVRCAASRTACAAALAMIRRVLTR